METRVVNVREQSVSRALDDRRLLVAGPPRHCDAEELERVDTDAAILECGPDRNVNGNACFQSGCFFTCAVRRQIWPSPERTCQNSLTVAAGIGGDGDARVCMEDLRLLPSTVPRTPGRLSVFGVTSRTLALTSVRLALIPRAASYCSRVGRERCGTMRNELSALFERESCARSSADQSS
jgi:hypothetical protein